MEILSLKNIMLCLVGLYMLALAVVFISRSEVPEKSIRELHAFRYDPQDAEIDIIPQSKTYRFTNPILAYKILSQLEVHQEQPNRLTSPKIPYLNLKNDDNYCDKHRKYIVEFPEAIFEKINFVTDGGPMTLMRNRVFPLIGNDIQPNIGGHMPKNVTTLFDIKPEATLFFTREPMFYEKRVGKHYSCITQMSNGVVGKHILGQKNRVAEEVKNYAKRYASRPQCFDVNNFYPLTYILYRKNECQEFFKIFNSAEYQALKEERKIVYIRKLEANLHSGKGVEPVTEQVEGDLRTLYKNGNLCGKVEDKYIIQTYIHNPLLLEGRKFDFRIYMMLASVNPLIAHYHDGFLRVSLLPYDVDSNDKKALLTNMGLSSEIIEDIKEGDSTIGGMNEEQLKDAQQWSYERLHAYLMDNGYPVDSDWLDNYLRPSIKKALVHSLRFGLIEMYEHSSLFQIWGVDFMLDDDLHLWFIEANSKPGTGSYSQTIENFRIKKMKDHVEIAIALLRSRMKRIVSYVNSMIEDKAYEELGKGQIAVKDLEQRRIVFQEITKNKFDPEFEVSADNGWSKIVDENYHGVERYSGLLEERCL